MSRTYVGFLFLFSFNLFAQSNYSLQSVLTSQDLRDARNLSAYLEGEDPIVRGKAALAAGSVQDPEQISQLVKLLGDVDSRVRECAAFALGQMNFAIDSIQRGIISRALEERITAEPKEDVLLRCVEALGKTGDEKSLGSLILAYEDRKRLHQLGEVALSIGRYAYRGIRNAEATDFVITQFDNIGTDEQWKAAYALMRIGDKNLLAPHVQAIVSAAQNQNADVRMYIATVLGKLSDSLIVLDPLIGLAESDVDWRVRVNAIKSISLVGNPLARTIPALLKAIQDPNEHVSLTALSSLSPNTQQSGFGPSVRNRLSEIIENAASRYSAQQVHDAVIAMARVFGVEAYAYIKMIAENGGLLRNDYIDALGYIPNDGALSELFGYARQTDPHVQRVALDAIVNSCSLSKPGEELLVSARALFRGALSSDDIAVLTSAASTLSDSLFDDGNSVSQLLAALVRLHSPSDVEPMVEIIRTLGKLKAGEATTTLLSMLADSDRTVALESASSLEQITGKSYKHTVSTNTIPSHMDFDWKFLDWIEQHPIVSMSTTKGVFRLILLAKEAPFTCISFARLIKKGFYGGLLFHRVVPNFVIQGGDPRGDGWGGPGYSLRSEFGLAHYERGTVGIASAGKDTEGCQFFITHSYQPHLDGRYTIFGKVLSGLNVVDSIQVGDKINRISFDGE